jgi:peptidoglycan hydrolase-like protein with peptidoglycan-binding domain
MKEGAEQRIQRRLEAKGFLSADEYTRGQLDQPTRESLRHYQKSEGLPPTGLPSYETVSHLGLSLDTIFQTATHPKDVAAGHSGSE